jgi:hypothetical protein
MARSGAGWPIQSALTLDEAALRERIRQTAAVHEQLAAELRAMAGGIIQRPRVEVLELERMVDLPPLQFIEPITG